MNWEKIFRKVRVLTIFIFNVSIIFGIIQAEELDMRRVQVIIKNEIYQVELEENQATQALLEILPLKINMQELNGNEKYGMLTKSLPKGKKVSGEIEVGDLMLYGDDYIVLFYKEFYTPYSYTRLGKIVDKKKLEKNIDKRDKILEVVFSK